MTTTFTKPSPRLMRLIESLRTEFAAYASGQEQLFKTRADLAPAFAKAYEIWKTETHRPLIAFVRELDPKVPADRRSYVNHRSLTAAWYLIRTAKDEARGKKHVVRKTLTPFEVLAAVIRGVWWVLPKTKADVFYTHVQQISHWSKRDIKRLQTAVGRAKPLGLFPEPPRIAQKVSTAKAPRATAADKLH